MIGLLESDAPPAFPFPGDARYASLGYLGEGCFGMVFKAQDLELDRPVALKVLHESTTPRHWERLKQEAQAQARLDHPNFCRIYEVGSRQGHPYLAMQFVDGPSLETAAPTLSSLELVALLADLAEALDAGHALGLAHRDVKANNILIYADAQGRKHPVLVDFGQAILEQDPAQARRHDLWSLGEMAYTLLGGFPSGAGPSSLQARLPEEGPARPRLDVINPNVPKSLGQVIERALCLDPQRAFPSGIAMAQALRGCIQNQSPPPRARYPWGWLGGLGLMLLGSLGVWMMRSNRAPLPAITPSQSLDPLREAIRQGLERLRLLESRLATARTEAERNQIEQEIKALKNHLQALEKQLNKANPVPFSPTQQPPPSTAPTLRPTPPTASKTLEGVTRPARMIQRVIPTFPTEGVEGLGLSGGSFELFADVLVDAAGTAQSVVLDPNLPAALRASVREAALASRFEPALDAGEPMEAWLRVTYRFRKAVPKVSGSPQTQRDAHP